MKVYLKEFLLCGVLVLLVIIAAELYGVIKAIDNIDFVRIDDNNPVKVQIVEQGQ